MHAIILAGGFGIRLRSAVSEVPKPLAPIGDRPFIALLTNLLITHGISGITLSVHHQWEKIRDYFAAHPISVPLDYAVEKQPLGTGGAIAYALRLHEDTAPVLVLNGDSFVQVDYAMLMAQHINNKSRLSIVLREVADTGRYGKVDVENNIVTSFGEGGNGEPGLINAGVYVMDPKLFSGSHLPEVFSLERDFIPQRLAILKPRSFLADDYFIDIGIPEDYARACIELPDKMR